MPDTPAITSKNLPTPAGAAKPSIPAPVPPSVEVEVPYSQIEAKPLRTPNFMNLFPVNPNLSIRWVNRAVGEKESGLRYDQCLAAGFEPAKPQDVYGVSPMTGAKVTCPPSLVRDGRIISGDVILMKIPRVDYVGALKWNEQTARARVKKLGVSIEGDTQLSDGRIAPSNIIPQHKKISTFVPQLAEVDAKTADNSGPEVNLAEKS